MDDSGDCPVGDGDDKEVLVRHYGLWIHEKHIPNHLITMGMAP